MVTGPSAGHDRLRRHRDPEPAIGCPSALDPGRERHCLRFSMTAPRHARATRCGLTQTRNGRDLLAGPRPSQARNEAPGRDTVRAPGRRLDDREASIDGRRRLPAGILPWRMLPARSWRFETAASYEVRRFWRCGAFPTFPCRPCRRDKPVPGERPIARIAVFGRSVSTPKTPKPVNDLDWPYQTHTHGSTIRLRPSNSAA